jgi:hypothetical protein
MNPVQRNASHRSAIVVLNLRINLRKENPFERPLIFLIKKNTMNNVSSGAGRAHPKSPPETKESRADKVREWLKLFIPVAVEILRYWLQHK